MMLVFLELIIIILLLSVVTTIVTITRTESAEGLLPKVKIFYGEELNGTTNLAREI
jgi:hypothetical protein